MKNQPLYGMTAKKKEYHAAANRSHKYGVCNNLTVIRWPFYVLFKRHRCFQCGGKLKLYWITQNIYMDSFEAQGKNLTWIGLKKETPIKYKFAIFKCKKCGHKVSIPQQRKLENPQKTYDLGVDVHGRLKQDDYVVYLVSQEKAKQAQQEKQKDVSNMKSEPFYVDSPVKNSFST